MTDLERLKVEMDAAKRAARAAYDAWIAALDARAAARDAYNAALAAQTKEQDA